MPRPRGDGIKIVRRLLADGTVREHRYVRKRPDDPKARPGTLDALIADYLGTPEFAALKPRTKDLYRGYLDQIRATMGWMPLAEVRPSVIKRVKIKLQGTPSKANMWLALLSIVFKHATEMDWIAHNPAAGIRRLPAAKRDQIWSRDEEARVMAGMRPSLRLAFMLLLYTVQRPSDVLAMTTQRVTERDGRLLIALRQQKTDELMNVPVHASLAPLLRERLATTVRCGKTESLLLIPSPRGLTWSRRNFSRAWDHDLATANGNAVAELIDAGMTAEEAEANVNGRHRQRRDLRRTGIVRLAEAGATTPQIAAISGHKIDYCQSIIDTYLPRRTEVAIGGIEVWEQAGSPKVVKLRRPGNGNGFGNRKR